MRGDTLVGPGSSAALAEVVRGYGAGSAGRTRTAMVVGAGFGTRCWATQIRSASHGLAPVWLTHRGRVSPASVSELAQRLWDCGASTVVAVGGGSVLDAAKAAVRLSGKAGTTPAEVVAACDGDVQLQPPSVRMVAVPTTPGTGAEVTPFATIWDVSQGRKLSLSGAAVTPAAAVLDPGLLCGLSPAQLCGSLLDSLCQGAEAAWSARATAESASFGLAAVTLAGPMLRRLDPAHASDADLFTLQMAGHLSGHAIARAPTSSCHAISYPLTLRAGLAHGHACGVSLGRMLCYNAAVTEADCTDPRGADRVRDVVGRIVTALGEASPYQVSERVDAFLRQHGLATLDEVPVAPAVLAHDALAYPRSRDNPRVLTLARLTRQLAHHPGVEDGCR
jgi:alcohol dehydrogenase class IV